MMVPEGWHMEILKNIVDGGIKNGYSPNAAEKNTGHWVLGLGALGDNGLIASEIKPVEATQKVLNCRLHPDDFLISRSNTPDKVGRSILFKGEIDNCSYPDLMMRFRVNEGIVDTGFIEEKLKSSFVRGYFKNCAAGSSRTMVKINKPIVEKTPLLLPPLHEQKKIARILSTWNKAIETVEKLIENSKAQKKALMQQLLTGKRRLPGSEGEWKTIKLSKLCKIGRGASPRPIKDPKWFAESGRGWVRISDVTASPTNELLSTTQYLSKEGTKNSVCVDPGDLIMSICGTIGVPKFLGIPACIHDGFVVFKNCSRNISLEFLYHFLDFISTKLISSGQPGTQKNLNTGIVGNIDFPAINPQEQQQIAVLLTSTNKKTETLQQKLDCLKQEKSALMQQLLTGKRRVKVDTDG